MRLGKFSDYLKGTASALATLVLVGCAGNVMIAEEVREIPSRPYKVTVRENPGTTDKYSAVLFEEPDNGIELNLSRLRSDGIAAPDRYLGDMKAGFTTDAIRDAKSKVRGYLVVPHNAHVSVWEETAKKDKLSVIVDVPPVGIEIGRGGGGGK